MPPSARSTHRNVDDPLGRYLSELRRHPLLDRDEELALARRSQAGDARARRRLIQSNLRLVVKIARDLKSRRIPMLDLIQEGNLGLIKAVERFDPERGLRLASWSQWWIRAHIYKHLMDNHHLIRIGTTQAQRKLFFNLNKARAHFERMGVEPTPERIAQHLNVRVNDVNQVASRLRHQEVSLDTPGGPDPDGPRLLDVLPDHAPEDAPGLLDRARVRARLGDAFARFRNTLQGRDVDIWERRMLNEKPATLQQLGESFGVSRERARQLEARLTRRLGEFLGQQLDPQTLGLATS